MRQDGNRTIRRRVAFHKQGTPFQVPSETHNRCRTPASVAEKMVAADRAWAAAGAEEVVVAANRAWVAKEVDHVSAAGGMKTE